MTVEAPPRATGGTKGSQWQASGTRPWRTSDRDQLMPINTGKLVTLEIHENGFSSSHSLGVLLHNIHGLFKTHRAVAKNILSHLLNQFHSTFMAPKSKRAVAGHF